MHIWQIKHPVGVYNVYASFQYKQEYMARSIDKVNTNNPKSCLFKSMVTLRKMHYIILTLRKMHYIILTLRKMQNNINIKENA